MLMLAKLRKTRLTRSNTGVNLSIGTCTKKVLKTKKNKLHHQKRLCKEPFLLFTPPSPGYCALVSVSVISLESRLFDNALYSSTP
jgi:hypothetical protein